MNFVIYVKSTGEIVQSGTCPESLFSIQKIPENCAILPICADPIHDYIKNNMAIRKPEKPFDFYVFDYNLKQWIDPRTSEQKEQQQKNEIKNKRNAILLQSDWTQLPNNPLTQEKQQEWAVYRQQLRDITIQSGYPFNVIWPTKPE